MTSTPRVIVTRPAREAQRWVNDLKAAGVDAVALPLIGIAPAGEAALEAMRAHRAAAGAFRALMFVSAAAASYFFETKVAETTTGRAQKAINKIASELFEEDIPRCWATGPGTARALISAGVPAALIDRPPVAAGRFDSEALWPLVAPQLRAGDRVLLLRGGDMADRPTGRDWLARQIVDAGAVCETAVTYRRLVPDWRPADRRMAESAACDGSVWLFSSSQAVANLKAWLPHLPWQHMRAIATHPRIAAAARNAGFDPVHVCDPRLETLVASIESIA